MSRPRKISWVEGSRITPHHFQQWDNFLEDQLLARVQTFFRFNYGVVDLEINSEAIANGQFSLVRLKALFPDGILVDMPYGEPCPLTREIGKSFEPTADRLDVFVAIPSKRPGVAQYHIKGMPGGTVARYIQTPGTAIDETSGEGEVQIPFAIGNYRILFGGENREGFSTIKIAEIKRSPTGRFILDDKFVPPLLDIDGSKWLMNQLRQLVEILSTKSTLLGDQRRHDASSLVEFTAMETGAFWLLHTVNGFIPRLKHLFATRAVHPEYLYEELATLEGQLMTFAVQRHPKDVIKYEHSDLFLTFNTLFTEIRDLLDIVISTKCVPIPLQNVRESVYVGHVTDDRLLQEASFFLAVRSQMSEREAIFKVPRMVKIAASDHIDRIVGAAMPGVNLNYASSPPNAIPTRPGYLYFSLETVGRFWEVIRGSKSLGVYVPDEFPEVQLEMYAVKP